MHVLQFVFAQQSRSLERWEEVDPIGPSSINLMYFSGHQPAQPSIDDDVPRVQRDDAHVVASFELRSVLTSPFIH
jgi:hypothetical protein